ncbi:hypothetical protein [Nodularia sp. UHCC 0506]|uniref:hypothetical protein n=1 Tax=Nodularia sp. UHCC 0506 TaxID=3110243 RepID=UPI002B1F3178|nr:hypothetical protein [Nodularia sp. UHCC 0506]MEA5516572.1 hypothetical protein [Nodularia sp. UHCC 0506]
MTETATLIPLITFIPIFTAISERNWLRFKELELEFADNYGVETWADVFNFRVMPALEPEAKRWLLIQKCSQGIKSVKILK